MVPKCTQLPKVSCWANNFTVSHFEMSSCCEQVLTSNIGLPLVSPQTTPVCPRLTIFYLIRPRLNSRTGRWLMIFYNKPHEVKPLISWTPNSNRADLFDLEPYSRKLSIWVAFAAALALSPHCAATSFWPYIQAIWWHWRRCPQTFYQHCSVDWG